eukprot:NP_494534.2 NEPrilysin metallopeptidase family [Caenorhabditis elegans]
MNVEKMREKFSSPWIALNLLLLMVFLALVTVHIKMTVEVKPVKLDELLSNAADSRNLCESPDCITLSHELLNYQDPSVDPCVDFFQHACGRFHEQSSVESRTQKKRYILQKQIREFLHNNKTSTSKSENLMKLVFDKCEALQKSQNTGYLQEVHEVFNDIKKIGAWPLLDKNWDESKFDLNEMLTNLVKLGATNFGLFQFNFLGLIMGNFVEIAPTEKSDVEEIQMVLDILKGNGIEPDREEISRELEEYSMLEKKLKIVKENETISLNLILPDVRSVNFSGLIAEMSHPSRVSKLSGMITPKIITNKHPLLFETNGTESLDAIIESTSNRTLANYLIFNYIQSSRDILTETYENCEQKVEAIKVIIGYPDHFDPPGTLDKEFEHIDLDSTDSFYRISQKLHRLRTEQQMEFIAGETPISPVENVLEVSAHYDPSKNALTFLAPFLDDPFFDTTYPDYANLFLSGRIIAHEIGHSVDGTSL